MAGSVRHPALSTVGTWERYRIIADNSGDVVYQTSVDGRIVWIQDTVTSLLGFEPAALVGEQARSLVHPDDLETVNRTRAVVYDGAEVDEIPCRFRTSAGGYRQCTVRARPLRDPEGTVVGAIMTLRDVSERVAALRALTTLSRAGAVLVSSRDEQTLLDDTCRTIVDGGHYAYCWYIRALERGLVPVASSGGPEGWLEDLLDSTDGHLPDDAPSRKVLARDQAVVIHDIDEAHAHGEWAGTMQRFGLRSALGLPVHVDGELDGSLVVFASEPAAFDTDAQRLLEELASTLGYGIGRLRDQHEREALLVQTEGERARLRATLDSLFEPLALLEAVRDESGRAVDLRYVEANDAAIAYNRTTREAMIGRTMLELFPNLADEGPLAHYLHCADTGEPVVLDDYAFPNRMMGEERHYDLRATQTPSGIALTWRDTTDRWRAAQRLADDERRYRLVAEHGSDILWELSADGRLVWASASTTRLLGWSRDELLGLQTLDLIHPDDLEAASEARVRAVAGDPAGGEFRLHASDGSYRWFAMHTEQLGEGGGRVVAMRDIQDERAGRARLEHVAAHDPTTGAPTRAVLMSRLQELLIAPDRSVALLCADIDGLSTVNESVSYAAGDEVLAIVADRIADVVGDWDLLGRGSGDELLVLLPDLADANDADAVADRIRAAVREPIGIGEHSLRMSVSVGIATRAVSGDAEQMLRDAGIAMQQAKEYGGDRASYADPDLSEAAARRLHLEAEIRQGLAEGAFHAWLQPIVSLTSGEVHGYEALVRWIKDDGTVVAPYEFLPLAERTGLVADLDLAVLDKAVAALPRLAEGTTVAVNLASVTLRRPGLAEDVLATLERHGVGTERLHLEVIETALLDDVPTIARAMHALADAGVHWYVDDFGTGYSSISHLRDLPIAGLKLDRSFTFGVAEGDRRCADLSQALVGLAEGLGLDGVAEGVETEAVARTLAAHGWKHGQGWLFGRPAPPPSA